MVQMDAKTANSSEHPDLQVFYRHWRVKRGWHPARHPCHPLICLKIYKRSMLCIGDACQADAR
jgi:hypothetical protein